MSCKRLGGADSGSSGAGVSSRARRLRPGGWSIGCVLPVMVLLEREAVWGGREVVGRFGGCGSEGGGVATGGEIGAGGGGSTVKGKEQR